MARFAGVTKWRFPILFGSILAGFATAFVYRQVFMTDVEDARRKHQKEDLEHYGEMLAHQARVNEQRTRIVENKTKTKEDGKP